MENSSRDRTRIDGLTGADATPLVETGHVACRRMIPQCNSGRRGGLTLAASPDQRKPPCGLFARPDDGNQPTGRTKPKIAAKWVALPIRTEACQAAAPQRQRPSRIWKTVPPL